MSEYMFLTGRGQLRNQRRIAAIAKRHGARFLNPHMPEGYRYWFAAPNLGHPFDARLRADVIAALRSAGLLDERGELPRQ